MFGRADGLKGRSAGLPQRELEVEGVRESFQREGGLQSGGGELQFRLKTPFIKVCDASRGEEDRS